MRLLLDTHIFLWYISADKKLSVEARDAISDPANEVYLSVVSLWEAIIKHRLGKLPLPQPPEDYLPVQRAHHRISSLVLDETSVGQLAKLPAVHRDPLNSRLFQSTPLRRSRLARLAWTQILKRSPVNLRALALVPAGRNPKGTALFALAALSRLRATRDAQHAREARSLLDDLLDSRVRSPGGHGAWGYNFDWQGRAFHAPRGTPAGVPTAFAVRALVGGTRAP